MKTSTITIILSLLMLLTATGIGHAIMEELSLEDLTRDAGTIVVGTVDDMEVDSVVTSDGGTTIYTFVHLSIHEVLKGRLEDRHVVVRVAGGKIGDLEIRMEDQPEFEKGQRVLVFLKQVDRELFEVYGLFQGVLKPSEETLSKVKRIMEATSSGNEDALFSLKVTTDKPHYEEGEDVQIGITATNEGDEEITLKFQSELQADYIIDGWIRGEKNWTFTTIPTSVIIPKGESHTWEFTHTSENTKLNAGIHTIVGLLTGYDAFRSASRPRATTEITVGDLGKIEGTVADEGGLALPDVRIVAYRIWKIPGMERPLTDPDTPDGELFPVPMMEPLFTDTDENGRFALEYLPVGETFLIGAFRKDYDLVWTEVEITSEAVPVEIILSETALATLTGHVLDQNGDSVSEAGIRAMAYPDFGWLDLFPELPVSDDDERTLSEDVHTVESSLGSMEPARSDLRSFLPLSRSFTASTNTDGRFVLEGVPVGWNLSVHAAKKDYEPAFSEVEMTSDPDDVKLTMTKLRLGQIRGIVMDKEDRSPIPEAHIVAIPKWDEKEEIFEGQGASGEEFSEEGDSPVRTVEIESEIISYPTRFGPYHAVTDENGEFALDEVNLDMRFVLWAYKEGYDPAHAEVEDPSDDAAYVEIALTKIEMGVLTGIVTDDSGEAVPGAEVLTYPEIYAPIPEIGVSTKGEDDGEGAVSGAGDSVQSPEPEVAIAPPRGPFQEYSATTDTDGRFVIERIPIGRTVAVSARKRGYEVAHRRIERTEEKTFVQLYLIAFEDEYPNRNAVVREGMRYEVAMDRMAYNADEIVRLRYRVMNLAEEVKTFSFPTSQRVEFQVLSMESNRDADPYSPDDDWEWPGKVIWRWSGGQEFDPSAGEITLAQGESAAFEGTLDLGALNSDERGFLLLGFLAGLRNETQTYAKFMIEREVLIDAQVAIAGVVTDAEGRPLPRANVAARTADVTFKSLNADVERHTVVTDERGRFVLKGLYRGGTYEVTAFREGYAIQQKIIYAIQEQNDVRFALHREDSGNPSANASVLVQDGVQIELITDGHFYAGADDVIRMCYRITNAREAPISFHFSNGQQVDFVLKQEDRVLWRWSDGRGFIEAETTLELPPGASKAFKTESALASLNAADGNLLLSGYLNLPEDTEKTRASLELTLGEAYEVVHVGTEESGLGPIQVDSRMGTLVELLAPSGIKGQIEFSEQTQNTLGDLAGHHFLRMVNFQPDPVLSAFVEQVYVELKYDPAQLNALGIESEKAVQFFIWDASGDSPGWRKVEGGVDPERNVAWGNVPNMGTQWALFAAEPSAVEEQSDLTPAAFVLRQNVPNPFNPATTIRFSIPNREWDAKVALVIYNAMGQRVRTLVEDTMRAGVHSMIWDGRDDHGRMVSSGVYLYRLTAGGKIQTRKMLLVK